MGTSISAAQGRGALSGVSLGWVWHHARRSSPWPPQASTIPHAPLT